MARQKAGLRRVMRWAGTESVVALDEFRRHTRPILRRPETLEISPVCSLGSNFSTLEIGNDGKVCAARPLARGTRAVWLPVATRLASVADRRRAAPSCPDALGASLATTEPSECPPRLPVDWSEK